MGKLKQKIKDFWNSIDVKHKMWLRLYLYFSSTVFVLLMCVLYFYYSAAPEEIHSTNPEVSEETQPEVTDEYDESEKKSDANSEGSALSPDEPIFVIHPKHKDAHRDLVNIYHQLGLYSQSLKHIETIQDFYADDEQFLSEAGKAFQNSGNPEKAMMFFEKAIATKKATPETYRDFAMAKYRNQEIVAAQKDLKKLIKNNPKNAGFIADLALTYGEQNPKSTLSDSLFKKATRLDPKNAGIWYQYGRKVMNSGNYFSAEKLLNISVKLDPLNSSIHGRIGMLQYYLHNFDKAEQLYKTSLSIHPQDFTTWYNLGELYFTQANRKRFIEDVSNLRIKSIDAFLKTLTYNSDHPWAHYKVGVLLNNNKQFKEAINHFKKAKNNFPENSDLLLQLALANEKIGNNQAALKYLEKAYYIDPFNKVISSKLRGVKAKVL
jgi:tetratricopeptide (TPR) repeat protein